MNEKNPKLIESPVRLSSSQFWDIQHNYFSSFGIDAFREDIPFYISSNAFVGEQYACIVLNYIRDWINLNPNAEKKFYILELGCGTGKFGFYFLKSMKMLLNLYHMSEIKISYIMSDSSEKNIEFCQKNKALHAFVENKSLDFAKFNAEKDKNIYLKLAQKEYSELQNKTPLIIIANYIFDSIRHDAFQVNNGKIMEVKYGITSRYKHFDKVNPRHLNELRFHLEKNVISPENYYENLTLNKILADYINLFQEQSAQITMPLGAFHVIDNLKILTENRYFMVIGDKGVTQIEDMPLLDENYIYTYDGCFSFQVNFDAISRYIKNMQGDALLTQHFNDFKVNLISSNIEFTKLINTQVYFNRTVEATGPDEYCYIYDEFLTGSYRFIFKTIISFIRFSHWDPNAYAVVHNRLMELLPALNPLHIQDLKKDLIKVRENIYYLDVAIDVSHLLGICYFTLDMENEALEMFLQSLEIYGDKPYSHRHAAQVYESQDNTSQALFHYTKAYELNNKDSFARRKIYQLSGKPHLAAIYPLMKALIVFGLIAVAVFLLTR